MKKIKLFSVLLALILCVSLFAACDSDDDGNGEVPSVQYTLTFDIDGGNMSETSVKVNENASIDLGDYVPTKEDAEFLGWMLDDEVVTTLTITKDMTVKAKWDVLFEYEANDDQSAYVLTFAKGKEMLTLPSMHDSKPVTSVKASAFTNADAIKTLVIGNSYTEIEEGAFSALNNIETLSVPFVKSNDDFAKLFEKVETVPENCYGVQVGSDKYAIPSSLVSLAITGGGKILDLSYNKFRIENLVVASEEIVAIEARTISENSYIKSVDISGCKNVTEIEDSNFENCKNLKNINIGGLEKLEVIGSHCFYYYDWSASDNLWRVESIDMSGLSALKVVKQMSFWYVDADTLDFSETAIEVFGRQNVMYCNVKNVKLPATLNLDLTDAQSAALEEKYDATYLNNSEFMGNITGLESITVDPLSLYLVVEDGALYDADKTVLYQYVTNDAKAYVAPATLKIVKANAFANATAITSADLSACNFERIERSAFAGCNAALTVGFDKYGYYATTGKKVELGSGWAGNCTVTYGERYLYFTVNVDGLSDNMTVADDSIDFTVLATYGDNSASVIVKVNGTLITKGSHGYTATLKDGANTIEIIASYDDKTSDTKTYTVTKNSKWTLKTSLTDGQKVVWANGNLTFTVWAENANGEKQDITDLVKIYVDCGYSTSFTAPFGGINVTYSDNVATVVFDSETLLMWDYDITKEHHIKVEVNQSDSISIDKIFDAQYFEKAPQIVSETPENGNAVTSSDWIIELQCKSGSTAIEIASITVTADYGDGFFGCFQATSAIAADKLSATVTIDVATLGMWGYIYNGDSFKIKISITLENGLTAEMVFNATYSE